MLVNKAATKKYILDNCAAERPSWEVTRVHQDIYVKLDKHLKRLLDRAIEQHPGAIGSTFIDIIF